MKRFLPLFFIFILFLKCGEEHDPLETGKHFLRSGLFSEALYEFESAKSGCDKYYGIFLSRTGMLLQSLSLTGSLLTGEGGLSILSEGNDFDAIVYTVLSGVVNYINKMEEAAKNVEKFNCEFEPGPIPFIIGNPSDPLMAIRIEGKWTSELATLSISIFKLFKGIIYLAMGVNWDIDVAKLKDFMSQVAARIIKKDVPSYYPDPSKPFALARTFARVTGPKFLDFSGGERGNSFIKARESFEGSLREMKAFIERFFEKKTCGKEVVCFDTCLRINDGVYDIIYFEERNKKCVINMSGVCLNHELICSLINSTNFTPQYIETVQNTLERWSKILSEQISEPIGLSELNYLLPPAIKNIPGYELSFPDTLSVNINVLFPISPEVGIPPSDLLPVIIYETYEEGLSFPAFSIEGEINPQYPSNVSYIFEGDSPHFTYLPSHSIERDCIFPSAGSEFPFFYIPFKKPERLGSLFYINMDNMNISPNCSLPSQYQSKGWINGDLFSFNAFMADLLNRLFPLIDTLSKFFNPGGE